MLSNWTRLKFCHLLGLMIITATGCIPHCCFDIGYEKAASGFEQSTRKKTNNPIEKFCLVYLMQRYK